MLHQVDVARKNCCHLDLVCFVDPKHWFLLPTRHQEHLFVSWDQEMCCMANFRQGLGNWWLLCLRCLTIFSGTRKGNAGAVQHIEQEKYPLWSRQHLSYERLQRSFLVLEVTHVPVQENTTFHSRTLVFAISNTNTSHLMPNASKVGLDESLCDVFEVTAPLRCALCTTLHSETLLCSFVHNFSTEPDQDFRKLYCLSFPGATATEIILGFDEVMVSCRTFIRNFMNCDTIWSSSSHSNCWLLDCIQRLPKQSCFPGCVTRINVKTFSLGSQGTSKCLVSEDSFRISSELWQDVTFVSDFLHTYCNFVAVAMMSLCACFFEESRSFFEDQNGQVPRANETLCF